MRKLAKAGNPRKSRRKRLNISGGTGPEEKFEPQPSDWQRIEIAYGQQLTRDDRDAITALVNSYFFWQPSEATAPYVDDAMRYLTVLEKSGGRFWEIILERENIPSLVGDARLTGDAILYVQSRVGRHLEEIDLRRKMQWHDLVEVLGSVIAAIRKARASLASDAARSGFVEGNAWKNLIWGVSEFARQRQLPFGVSKADDPQKASPFVRFVHELQVAFPARFRRHDASYVALAEAISVARRQIKRAIASREAEKIKSSAATI